MPTLNVYWDIPVSYGEVDHYSIRASETAGGPTSEIQTTPSGASTLAQITVDRNVDNFITVTSVDSTGAESPPSNEIVVVADPLSPPTNVRFSSS